MVGIIDYEVGNLFSLASSLKSIGQEVVVSGNPDTLIQADRLILPGVGAFENAAFKLRQTGMDSLIREQTAKGVPLLGICLGMQMLFEKSFEYGEHEGLGLLKGQIVPLAEKLSGALKIPHMGWNQLHITKKNSKLFANTREGEYVYFVHSYFADGCGDALAATSEYGIPVTAAVEQDNLFGCQFHPEKSGRVGLEILRAFCGV